MEFIRAESLDEVSQLLAEDPFGSKLIAGGTALVLMMKSGLVQPDRLISTAELRELVGIDATDDHVTIRASTSITDAGSHPVVRSSFPGLATALEAVGNVRIRNVATVAGNVAEADYASDPPSVLVALGAEAVVHGVNGQRVLPVDEVITGFYTTSLEPDEVITAVRIPRRQGQRSTYLKYRTRSTEDRPCVGVAATLQTDADGRVQQCSVVVGAAGPRPQHFPHLTSPLLGHALTRDGINEIAARYGDEVEAMEDQRGSAWYRKRMVEVFVRRALSELADPEVAA